MTNYAVYPSTYTDTSTQWTVLLCESINSDGGSAGDGITVNVGNPSTTKFIFLHLPSVTDDLSSKDNPIDLPGNSHMTTFLGTLTKTITLKGCYIIDRKVSEYNKLRQRIEGWMESGNTVAGTKSLYLAICGGTEGGNKQYLTYKVDGTWQNWAKVMIKKARINLSWNKFVVDFTFKFSEN